MPNARRIPRHHLSRRARGTALIGVSASLVPWIATLWTQLPLHGHSRLSRNWWVGLDTAEASAFATAGLLHLLRDPRQIPALRLAAGLLILDGIVDLSMAHTPDERRAAILMLPIEGAGAAWCLRIARFASYELAGFDTEKPEPS